jgi:hypothetical protein
MAAPLVLAGHYSVLLYLELSLSQVSMKRRRGGKKKNETDVEDGKVEIRAASVGQTNHLLKVDRTKASSKSRQFVTKVTFH